MPNAWVTVFGSNGEPSVLDSERLIAIDRDNGSVVWSRDGVRLVDVWRDDGSVPVFDASDGTRAPNLGNVIDGNSQDPVSPYY